MNDDDDFVVAGFCVDARLHTETLPPRGPLTGWENVVFELADEDETAE